MSKNILVEVYGKTLDEAINIANDNGYYLRVTSEDGKYFVCIRDYRTDRINVGVIKGVVVKADIG